MSVLIGMRIELRDAQGVLAGAIYCEDTVAAVAIPQRGDLVALTAIAGSPTGDSSLSESQAVYALADAFPFLTVDHLEHYPTADHQIGGRPGCMVVFHGRAPLDDKGASAVVRLFGLKGWTISPAADPNSATPFRHAAYAWLAEKNRPRPA